MESSVEEVEVRIPKKLAEELAKVMSKPEEVSFKTAEELLSEKAEKTDLEDVRTLYRELREALNKRDFSNAKLIARELKKTIEKKKKEVKGAFAPALLYEAEVELGFASEILQDPSLSA